MLQIAGLALQCQLKSLAQAFLSIYGIEVIIEVHDADLFSAYNQFTGSYQVRKANVDF